MRFLHYIFIIYVFLSWLIFQSCSDSVSDDMPLPESDCINLTVNVPSVSTRAGADRLNEFSMKNLHFYFFREEGHDDATSESVYDIAVDGEFDYTRRIKLSLPDDALREGGLFGPTANECFVYAIANVAENELTGKTVNELKATAVGGNFDKTEIQDSFTMDGFSTLSLDRTTRTVTGTVNLKRSAAKLSLAVDIPASIDVEEKIVNPFDGSVEIVNVTYYSRAEEMRVWITNGVKSSKLNTPPGVVGEDCLYSNEIISSDGVGSPFEYTPEQPKYRYVQSIPFYSYPNKWDLYSPNGNCTLTLVIPWYHEDKKGATHNVATYYRMNVQPDRCMIERNTHYDMRVTIERLGGTSLQQPVDMIFDWYYSMQWNMQTLPTDIKEIRYLLLNNNDFSDARNAYYYVMENEKNISIPYNSSHPVEIESVELSWYDYYNDRRREVTLTKNGTYKYSGIEDYKNSTHFAGIEIDPVKSTLNLRRDLLHIYWRDNSPEISTTEAAINAYDFRIKLRHVGSDSGDPSANATVVISQIPAISITTNLTASGTRFINNQNTKYEFRNGNWPNYTYYYKGYVTTSEQWPRGNETKQRYWLGSYHDDNNVQNKHTYILTISKFAAGDDYIIADPRARKVDNLNEDGVSATSAADWSMSDGSRQLQNYYPGDNDNEKKRFIAPQLRVASQWGVTYQISRRGAERRCASYQEDGRPAGRWRLPTVAEIQYICRLSNKKFIPYLFGTEGNTANYWCASGGVDVDNDTNNPSVTVADAADPYSRRAVRCVYDEWFWKADTLMNKKQFKWGDQPRSISGNQR